MKTTQAKPPKTKATSIRVSEGVDVQAYRLAFLDEWSRAISHARESSPKADSNINQKVESLLYSQGWNGSWNTLLAQLHRGDIKREHPTLKYLIDYGGIFWLAFWKCSQTRPSWHQEGSVWNLQ